MQINKDNICKNIKLVYHDYKVRDKIMLNNQTAYKYEIPYKGPFVITRCFTNGMVNLQYGPTTIRYNIRRIDPHKSVTNVEDINPKNRYDEVNT